MGCRTTPYWLGTFLFDYTMYFLVVIAFIIGFLSANFPGVNKNLGYISLALLFFGIPNCTLSYVMSFFFQKFQTAVKIVPTVNFLLMFMVPLLVYAFCAEAQFVGLLMMLISPLLTLYIFFQFMAFYDIVSNLPDTQGNYFVVSNVWLYFAIFIVQGIAFMLLCLFLENKRHALSDAFLRDDLINQGSDIDIISENKRVVNSNDIIKVQQLTKTYGNGKN
jgi:ATP-binding cassette subfamily A (ABC1) protein 3